MGFVLDLWSPAQGSTEKAMSIEQGAGGGYLVAEGSCYPENKWAPLEIEGGLASLRMAHIQRKL